MTLKLKINGMQKAAGLTAIDEEQDSLATVSWMFRTFLASVRSSYLPYAPRRREANMVVQDLLNQLEPQMAPHAFVALCMDVEKYLDSTKE